MKKILLYTAFFIAFAASVSAQTSNSKLSNEQMKNFKSKMEAYKVELKLTMEQQTTFEEINMKFIESLAALNKDNSSRLKKLKKYRNVKIDRDKKIKEILTPDQYRIFLKHQREFKDQLGSSRF